VVMEKEVLAWWLQCSTIWLPLGLILGIWKSTTGSLIQALEFDRNEMLDLGKSGFFIL
jgi:hypothetical protein